MQDIRTRINKKMNDPQVKRTKDGKLACEHGRNKNKCKDCGTGCCIHDQRKDKCRLCAGYMDLHLLFDKCHCPNKTYQQQRKCKNCLYQGGGDICIHGILKTGCKPCGGKLDKSKKKFQGICEHQKKKVQCKICDPNNYILGNIRSRIHDAVDRKQKHTIEYLGCNTEDFRKHIESQFKEGMSWDNYGKWEIDHIIPLKYNNPTFEQVQERLYWTNTQPMWKYENMSKGNRYVSQSQSK